MTVEFRAEVRNGSIQLPEDVKKQFQSGRAVKVVLCEQEDPAGADLIEELMRHPLEVPGFKAMSRDEIYGDR